MEKIEKKMENQTGAELIDGILYRVKPENLIFAEPPANGEFGNPRTILSGFVPKGLSEEEMEELYESIRTTGMDHPFKARPITKNGKIILQIVDGERRARTIFKLKKDNASCYDQITEEFKPASELYATVECRIKEMDDQTAFKNAYQKNDQSVSIGEAANIALIRTWREAGFTDEQIMDMTGKGISWLRETDRLCTLDEETFEALATNKINRTAASDLANEPNLEQRIELLKTSLVKAQERNEVTKQILEEEIDKTEMKAELAAAAAVEAEFNQDDEAKEAATTRMERLRKKALDKKKKVAEISDTTPQVTSKDLANAKKQKAQEGNGEAPVKALSRSKIEKFWREPVVAFIKAEGLDEENKPVEGIDLEDARLTKLLLDHIDKGEKDVMRILKAHMKQKEKRASE